MENYKAFDSFDFVSIEDHFNKALKEHESYYKYNHIGESELASPSFVIAIEKTNPLGSTFSDLRLEGYGDTLPVDFCLLDGKETLISTENLEEVMSYLRDYKNGIRLSSKVNIPSELLKILDQEKWHSSDYEEIERHILSLQIDKDKRDLLLLSSKDPLCLKKILYFL